MVRDVIANDNFFKFAFINGKKTVYAHAKLAIQLTKTGKNFTSLELRMALQFNT